MTPAEHYAEAERVRALAVDTWMNPEGGWDPTDDSAEISIRIALQNDARNDAMAYFALAQVHATLALYRPEVGQ